MFGIGCMPFEIPTSLRDTDWAALVQKELLAIPAVETAVLQVPADSLTGQLPLAETEEETTPDNYRGRFWPEPDFSSSIVELTIPQRLHEDLIRSPGLGVERFRVETHYGWHGPVTYVSLRAPGRVNTASVSTGVQLVSAFLTSELAKTNSSVRMARVGPSPFHAQVLLSRGDRGSGAFEFEVVDRHGYETIQVKYDPDTYQDVNLAQMALFSAIDDQLQLFYSLVREQNRRALAASEISNQAAILTSLATDSGTRAWFKRVFATGSRARRLGLEALQARLVAAEDERRSTEAIRSTLAQSNAVPIFETHLLEVAANETDHIIQGALDIVALAESSRSRDFEVAVVAASTLLGAAAGAIAGLLAGGVT